MWQHVRVRIRPGTARRADESIISAEHGREAGGAAGIFFFDVSFFPLAMLRAPLYPLPTRASVSTPSPPAAPFSSLALASRDTITALVTQRMPMELERVSYSFRLSYCAASRLTRVVALARPRGENYSVLTHRTPHHHHCHYHRRRHTPPPLPTDGREGPNCPRGFSHPIPPRGRSRPWRFLLMAKVRYSSGRVHVLRGPAIGLMEPRTGGSGGNSI